MLRPLLITTVLAAFQSAGPDKCPTWVLFTVLLSALPWGLEDTVTPITALYGQISPWPLSSVPGGPGLGFHGRICRQSLLAPCWLRGQGLALGFSLK